MLRESSGSNGRVVEVMNFLASRPTEAFTLSELAANLGFSIGSAHRLLTTLTDAGYVSRHPRRKTYSIGMALVALGQAALTQHRGIDVARREISRLAQGLGVHCHVCTVINGELLFLAAEGNSENPGPAIRAGDRRPHIPPLGIVYAAWASPEVQQDYISRAPAALSARVRDHLTRSLAIVRRRGYALAGSGPAFRALRQFTSQPIGQQTTEAYWEGLHQLVGDLSEHEVQLLSFEEADGEGISAITAPVFSSTGHVSLELSLTGLPAGLTRFDFNRHVEELLAAAAIVTEETDGRAPPPLDPPGANVTEFKPRSAGRRPRRS